MDKMEKWRRLEHLVGTAIDDAAIVLDVQSGRYFGFNVTAAEIWEALLVPDTIEGVAAKLAAKYNVAVEPCQQSVARVFGELAAKGLIAPQ